jgi:hypothetical protein
MADFLQSVVRLLLAIALDIVLVATGRLVLPLLSLGRIKVETLH